MNTWLSGISPVAAEFGSACRADGPELVVVLADAVAELLDVGPALGALLLLEPQPATSNAAAKTKTGTRAGISGDGRFKRLNGA